MTRTDVTQQMPAIKPPSDDLAMVVDLVLRWRAAVLRGDMAGAATVRALVAEAMVELESGQ
jgi:hypothetical protein